MNTLPKIGSNMNRAAAAIAAALLCAGCGSSQSIYSDERCTSPVSATGSLGPEINSTADEFAPWVAADGAGFHFSSGVRLGERPRKEEIREKGGAGRYSSMFIARSAGSSWGSPDRWNCPLPQGEGVDLNPGSVSFSGDERRAIYAAGRIMPNGGASELFDLYEVVDQGGGFGRPMPLDSVNDPDAWDSQPALSPDGSTLYFVSDRPRSQGEKRGDLDIYVATRTASGWSAPRNIGPAINTAKDELSPHISSDGHFYFASNGNPGEGGDRTDRDIFRIPIASLGSGRPERLPSPINSGSDDDFPFITRDRREIYLASNRPGGCGGRDLYRFETPKPTIRIAGTITARESEGAPLRPVATRVLIIDDATGRSIEARSGSDGSYRADVEEDRTYRITIADLPCFQPAQAKMVRTVRPYGRDTTYRSDLSLIATPFTTITLGRADVPFFITGYWHPNTPENLREYRRRDAEGTFANAPYIHDDDYAYDSASSVVQKLFRDSVYSVIRERALPSFFGECLPVQSDAMLVVLVKGYTDPLTLQYGFYVDDDVTVGGSAIGNGDVMQDAQGGNIKLSKLRAYYTLKMIDEELARADERYRTLKSSGRVMLACDGYGIDRTEVTNFAYNRRVDVIIRVLNRDEARRFVEDTMGADALMSGVGGDGKN